MAQRKTIILILACLLVFGNIQVLRAQSAADKAENVEVEVEVPVLNDDVASARERALNLAQRRAVELVVGVFVNAATLVGKAELVDNQIFSKTNGYVKKYEVLSEKREGDALKMKVKALVKTGDVNRDLDAVGLMIKGATIGNPRVMVLFYETVDGTEESMSVAEVEIAQKFMDTGYRIVEQAEVKKIRALPGAKAAMGGDIEAAVQIGKDMKVDILVLGRAASNFNTDKGLGGFISYRASVTAKVIKIDTSEVLWAVPNKLGAGVDLTKENAAKTAITKIAKSMSEDMVLSVTKILSEKAMAQLTISNIPDWNRLAVLNEYIKSYQGVSGTYIRSYETTTGVASIDINLKYGNAQQLSLYLSSIKRFPIEVSAVTGSTIQAKAK
ncbi:hypothetical protein COY52_11705 [Candidatus Desantisbacteria bacterium CG_4_10_14_0_8_um_filter_48_22]|uniref:Flagellar assembly protein T N-terminal domain-containing protein n=1 Tax=Candidatus Desantisbacteria bacterium CG_4_10_14_0_8_um_filter_48_22 TaxID=1974543 RepID=A0A2M7S5N4_9BACT|nr:MAG: hypothetical protein AUJ67_01575 [Candidatus Desantisbacteria bacterium CG1_02_49_89]PIV57338.1 MAG: hypothetical protein COS16_01045 [Candidatus Desantisbacteria bacterium CG02_land_8_20_14_3_00_49_13]PIZ14613.1 MAG: hypothetical protein COY52_11705 [Candidatus Desantisbacteria bacterium CG_4_10_14_0_8_um_filter_48_22]